MNEFNVLQTMLEGTKRATTAIVLTHNIDFIFAQNVLVNRLRRAGAPRLTVFADAGCATASYTRQSELADRVGHAYRVVPVDLGAPRRFHAKAILLVGSDGAKLTIGSGNLGHGGWSGNREIWTYFDFPGEGGREIAAFRDYLGIVCGLAGAADAVRATVLDSFQTEEWAASLPEPGGLLALPAGTPIMDRLLAGLDRSPTSFDVLAPYFDAEGHALGELARRLDVPMRVLLQHKKAGLSEAAAGVLPPSATILGVSPAEARQTIHAKVYAARYPDHVLVFAGSANCSRMALLRSNDGNAELMATSRLTSVEYEELLAGITISDGPPELPETAPNDDWDPLESPEVRVLSASFESGALTVRCKFAGAVPAEISLILYNKVVVATLTQADAYTVEVADPGSRLWAEVDGPDGRIRSAPMWIDHEAELQVGRPEQDVNAKLVSNTGPISSDGLIEIFSLFLGHLSSPIPWSGAKRDKKAMPVVPYNIDEVFSDGFGRRGYAPVRGGGHLTSDEWSLMLDYFRVGGGHRPPPDRDPPEGDKNDPAKSAKPAAPALPLDAVKVKKLTKLVTQMVTAMSAISFLESRPPGRLGADIQTTALLLAVARRREGMDVEKIDKASAGLFRTLFLGGEQGRALFDVYLQDLPTAADEMQSSRLTSAITLWIADLLSNSEAGAGFEFAVSRLAARLPWLTKGKDDLDEEMRRLSTYAGSLAEALPQIWISWIRGGAAVGELIRNLASLTASATEASPRKFYPGEIVWVADQFAIVEAESVGYADAYLFDEARRTKFMGAKVMRVADMVGQVIPPSEILDTLERMLSAPRSNLAAAQ